MDITIRLDGLRELQSRLRALSAEVRGGALQRAVQSGANLLADAIAAQAAVAFQSRTGRLARAAPRVKTVRVLPSSVVMEVGPRGVRYAHLVERGHRIVPRGPSRKGADAARRAELRRALRARRAAAGARRVAARPFIAPALARTNEQIARKMLDILWEAVNDTYREL
jgi:HK97 gp10 family phage protein